jgi:hypothetical protein
MYISIDQDYGGAAPFIRKRKKLGSGETERESVCVRVLVETADSIDQHPQTTWVEKHMGNIFRHKECGGIFD